MKKLNSLNLGKGLSRSEMRNINGGKLFGTSCSNDGYSQMDYCCKHTFGIAHSCFWA